MNKYTSAGVIHLGQRWVEFWNALSLDSFSVHVFGALFSFFGEGILRSALQTFHLFVSSGGIFASIVKTVSQSYL